MRFPRKRGSTSVMVRVFIPDNSATNGAGISNLTSASTNLTVAYIRELDGSSTTYTGANIEAQTTVGTYQAPSSSSKIRFKPVDTTSFPGMYELQFHDSATAFGTGDTSQHVIINIYEATTTALKIGPNMVLIPLVPWDYQDGVRMGLTGLANAVPGAAGGLFIAGTNAATTITTALTTTFTGDLTGSVGSVAGAVGSVTGLTASDVGAIKTKTDFLPSVTAGAAGGVFIAGTNAATTITTALTTTFTGNLTGSVASVSGAVGSVSGLTASDVGAIKTKTDFLPSATAGTAGGVFIAGANAATSANITGNITGNLSGSVGSVTGLTASNLDATISSRMATYTQPTGFLAATFPSGTIANTTNITAGTMTTTTNLTNLPSIPGNWITAAGIAASALNGKGDWLLAANYTAPSNLTAAQIATGVWQDATAGDFTAANSVGKSVMNGVSLGTGLTVNLLTNLDTNAKADVENAVWDATLSSHLTALTTGAALNAAGAAGDPWGTSLPGLYAAGTAGHILGNVPDVAAGAAGGLLIAGTNAPVTIAGIGNALTLTSTGGNGAGLSATGDGTGDGIFCQGGNGTNGDGIHATAGTGSGVGMRLQGGNTSGAGLRAIAQGGNSHGIEALGTGTGDGFNVTGGPSANGDGIHAIAGGGVDIRGNITGTVDTVTNLTNAPSSGDLTAAMIASVTSAVPSANDNADALLDRADAIETGLTVRQSMRLFDAALAGKSSGGGTGTITFRNAVADSTDRIIATVDGNNNRTAITTDVS